MKPAAVLNDLSCSSRRAACLLRTQQCHPGRPGRLVRVGPALGSSNPAVQNLASADGVPSTRHADNGQQQQSTPQKLPAAAAASGATPAAQSATPAASAGSSPAPPLSGASAAPVSTGAAPSPPAAAPPQPAAPLPSAAPPGSPSARAAESTTTAPPTPPDRRNPSPGPSPSHAPPSSSPIPPANSSSSNSATAREGREAAGQQPATSLSAAAPASGPVSPGSTRGSSSSTSSTAAGPSATPPGPSTTASAPVPREPPSTSHAAAASPGASASSPPGSPSPPPPSPPPFASAPQPQAPAAPAPVPAAAPHPSSPAAASPTGSGSQGPGPVPPHQAGPATTSTSSPASSPAASASAAAAAPRAAPPPAGSPPASPPAVHHSQPHPAAAAGTTPSSPSPPPSPSQSGVTPAAVHSSGTSSSGSSGSGSGVPSSSSASSGPPGGAPAAAAPASAAAPPPPPHASSPNPAAAAGAAAPPSSSASHPPPSAATTPPPPSSPTSSPPPSSTPSPAAINASSSGFQLRPMHLVVFAAIFLGGALFAALTLQFTADLDFPVAASTVARRVARSVAFRQLCVIAGAICLVRFGLNNVLKALAKFSASPVQWDKSKVYYILKEVYQPLELLLFIAAICTIADAFVPQLIAVPRSTVSTVVRSTLSVSFIIGAATVVFNLKSRFCKENAWQSEMNGDVTAQRRWEAYDKLGTFVIYTITFVLGIQALGLEVTSVLAIGGIGGLAIGLAGREICENILNGFLIMSTSPFEVGDEVHFFHSSKVVEGIVLDIGWYRTTIRSYEREVYVIPNAVFSKNIVLNITRKHREWRFFEMICVRVQDVHKVNAIIQDIRRIVRNDSRIITKLHRRIFLDKLTLDDCRIYVSFYVEAANRESFMSAKQDLLLAFVDCVERNGAKLAVPRSTVSLDQDTVEALSPLLGAAVAMAAAKVSMDVQQAAGSAAAAAAAASRALTDGRTITAEVTTVPTSSSPLGSTAAAAGGTTATSARAVGGSGGGGGGSTAGGKSGGGGGGGGAVDGNGGGTAGGSGGAATAGGNGAAGAGNQGSSTKENGLTWVLSRLAHMLFEV
ncbi:hypothetical protein Agub_g10027 [Astrephomene gubernaculifera]|uniref:Uncharacterized protein n=1 Tax=Astrephomene gubernaculifera TaxID=47775 RepID=A0AAD3DU43_9CHLO|nr:hypothetical protein Agub_g10027 [Astrephomene gubernaculifera]